MAKTSKSSRPVEVPYKPSFEVNAKSLGGKNLKVGSNASVMVKGRVIEERIDRYSGGKKFYRIEVDKISTHKKGMK